jgi:hypothetical protein
MRELTFLDLDAELAEQLPARELMSRGGGWGGDSHSDNTWQSNNQFGLLNIGVNIDDSFND